MLQSIPGRRNGLDLVGDQRGGHHGQRTMRIGEEGREEQGQVIEGLRAQEGRLGSHFKAHSAGRTMSGGLK